MQKFTVFLGTLLAAAVLKNLRLEGDLETFNDFFSLIISLSSYKLINFRKLITNKSLSL